MTFHAPPDDAGGAGTELTEDPAAPAGSALADIGGPVEGDKPVDFSLFGAPKKVQDPSFATDTLETDPKVTTDPSEALAELKKKEAKSAEADEAARKLGETQKATREDLKKEEPKPEVKVEAKKEEKLPTVEEIDAMRTKPGAPEAIVKHFDGVKRNLKAYAILAKELQAELETERAKKATLGEEQAKELEDLRASRMIFEEETSPAVQEKITAKFRESDASLFTLLKSPALGLNDEGEKLVRNALDNYNAESAKWLKEKILDRISDPLTRARVEQGIVARFNAADEQQKELGKLRENKDNWLKGRAEEQKKEAEQWADKARGKAADLTLKHEWMQKKQIPEGATKEAKAAAERHNAELDEKTKEFQSFIMDVYQRHPEKLVEAVFMKFQAQHLESQLQETTTERDDLKKRVEELEGLVGDARDAGQQKASAGGAEPKDQNEPSKGLPSGDAASAIAKFQWGKRGK